jgi:hypothetical protein
MQSLSLTLLSRSKQPSLRNGAATEKLQMLNNGTDDARLPTLLLMIDRRPLSPDPALEIEEPVNQSSSARKRRAPEDITNSAKRHRAPRASQPSVAQAFEEFGPKYRTRRRGIVAEVPSGSGGKENSQPFHENICSSIL